MLIDAIGLALTVGFLSICFWGLYNLPILTMGIRDFRKNKKTARDDPANSALPSFSILLPVKNEENVITSLLTAFSNLNYPEDKREIIVIEDGSTDKTLDMCLDYARNHVGFTVLHGRILTRQAFCLELRAEPRQRRYRRRV